MDSLLKAAKSDYFSGTNKPGMADYMIWPWFERISFMKDLVGKLIFSNFFKCNVATSSIEVIVPFFKQLVRQDII